MRSSELARLAHVSVRALRHYHQLGLLDEPSRSANGYRRYTVHDLVRVLRIRRLSELGLSLAAIWPLLDDGGDAGAPADGAGEGASGAAALLDALDADLTAQIERLERQRGVVAELRRWGAAPDLPPELTPYAAVFTQAAVSAAMARYERDQAILFSHLAGPEMAAALADVYARVSSPAALDVTVALTDRLTSLPEDAPEEAIEALAGDIARALAEVVDGSALRDDPADGRLALAASLIHEHSVDLLSAAQRQVIDRVEALLGEKDGGG